MFDGDELARRVRDELRRNPDVDAAAVAVSGRDGRVTLRGTVGRAAEKDSAGKAAENVFGVVVVDNRLEVVTLNARMREDAELRAGVLEALMLDAAVPASVDVKVAGGLATLTGTASWQYQRASAGAVAGTIVGDQSVRNEIELAEAPSADASAVTDAIARLEPLQVATSAGKLAITGRVRSWAERDDAIAAAWATPGVTEVEDRITVVS
jgi:osmotically-inducible protein OsmY